jgi:hypothetical protein
VTENQSKLLDDAFDQWWLNEGSGMVPLSSRDHVLPRSIARIAWHNGAYVKFHQISPPEAS